MTDAREMLRVLRDDLDAILAAVPVPKTRKVVRSRLNAILDAMTDEPDSGWTDAGVGETHENYLYVDIADLPASQGGTYRVKIKPVENDE